METTLNGHRAWYDLQGEDGSPVLLIMGFGMSGRAWAPQVRQLKDHHRVAYYDNRGIGQSESSRHAYGFRDLADDAAALLDHLGWDDAHVVGVSMGGMIAQHLALARPGRLRSLTLIATHPGGGLHRTFPTRKGLQLFLKANTSRGDERLEALRHLLYTPDFLSKNAAEDDFPDESMELFAVPADKATLMNQLKAILSHDVRRDLRRLDGVPTLVVRPGADLLVRPHHSDRIHRLIPGSRLLSFDRAGHGVTHERASEVNQHLRAHFAEVDLRRSGRAAA